MSTPWCSFVLLLQSPQDGDGRLHRRLVHQHLLEATLQRGVLLDVLAILVEGSGPDAMELAARKSRLEHVARVNRTLGLACTDHGMNLVDKDDDAPFLLSDFLQDGLQALFEFAAILGTG